MSKGCASLSAPPTGIGGWGAICGGRGISIQEASSARGGRRRRGNQHLEAQQKLRRKLIVQVWKGYFGKEETNSASARSRNQNRQGTSLGVPVSFTQRH
ncbi:hypothetical protein GOBAR_AA18061 [Gossypium barbadense]|uniref:Uncharacterized protein n=1 Tax=Gossypium barbadense TaxID=3634 RepID=A0A2P5XGX2_GOSBA|nr:hypothetical protein GOBAR_AA18061 [Gossypium barbadense]